LVQTLNIFPISNPTTKIKIIFENYDKYDNAHLYQNIIEYANLPTTSSGFKFIELGRWLMEKNIEFRNYYSDSKAHTPISARIANKRQRIQNCIDNLTEWNFLVISKMVTAKKNNTKTPLYVLTPLGKLIFLIVKSKYSNIEEEKNNAIKEIIDIITSIKEYNDSAIVLFITELLNQLMEKNKINYIIQHFERVIGLELNNGTDFLSYLLGIKHFIHWFIIDKEISFRILKNLPENKRNIILLNLKTEIEYFYQQNFLLKDDFFKNNYLLVNTNNINYSHLINNGALPSSYWENTRIQNINSFSKVVVPSFCNICNSHRAFLVNIGDYMKSIVQEHHISPKRYLSGNCIECGNSLFTHIIGLSFGSHIS
jgi:hypothetical protein